jgi:hypothetical protein
VARDEGVRRQEALGVPERFEPLHLALLSAGWLVRILCPVVQGAALPVLDHGQDIALGCRATDETFFALS